MEPLDLPEENGPPLDSDKTFGNLGSKGHEPASLACGEDDGLLGDHENSIDKGVRPVKPFVWKRGFYKGGRGVVTWKDEENLLVDNPSSPPPLPLYGPMFPKALGTGPAEDLPPRARRPFLGDA